MFVGASAGSTGGGIKVVRILVAVKVVLAEFEHVYQRKVVRSVKVGKTTIDSELKLNTLVYIISIGVLFGLGTLALMVLEGHQGIDITTCGNCVRRNLEQHRAGAGSGRRNADVCLVLGAQPDRDEHSDATRAVGGVYGGRAFLAAVLARGIVGLRRLDVASASR